MSKAGKKPGYSCINMQDVLKMRDSDKAIDRVQQAVDDEIARRDDEMKQLIVQIVGADDWAHFQRALRLYHKRKRQEKHQEFVLRSVC